VSKVKALAEVAMSLLQHDTGPDDKEWHFQMDHLQKGFRKILKDADGGRADEVTRLRAELDAVTDQRNNWADTVHAIAVKGLGLTDPLEQESGELPADWLPATGVLSDRVLALRTELETVTRERDKLIEECGAAADWWNTNGMAVYIESRTVGPWERAE
jgi:hypothetical protein